MSPAYNLDYAFNPWLVAGALLSVAVAVLCAIRSAKYYIGPKSAWRTYFPATSIFTGWEDFSAVGQYWRGGFWFFLVVAVIAATYEIKPAGH